MKLTYTYRYCDGAHTFASKSMPGFIVAHGNLAAAYELIPGTPQMPVDEFLKLMGGPLKIYACTNIIFDE